MPDGSLMVRVVNDAQYPLRNLVIAHHQDSGDARENTTQQFNGIIRKGGNPPQYLTSQGEQLLYVQNYAHGTDHWVVTWENHCDLAVYYLIADPNLLIEIERDVLDAMDDALEEAMENPEIVAAAGSATVSDGAGAAGDSAALILARYILLKKKDGYLSYTINNKDGMLDITLDCRRGKARIKEKEFNVKCHVYQCKS